MPHFAITHIAETHGIPIHSIGTIEDATAPHVAMEWETPILREIGAKRFVDVSQIIRDMATRPTLYKTPTSGIKRRISEITAKLPQFWNQRAPIVRKFKTREIVERDDLIEIDRPLDQSGIITPTELAICAKSGISALSGNCPFRKGSNASGWRPYASSENRNPNYRPR